MNYDTSSPFAQFLANSKGYEFVSPKGRDLDKWEAYEILKYYGAKVTRQGITDAFWLKGDIWPIVRVRESKHYF